jgi:hypothetical protein
MSDDFGLQELNKVLREGLNDLKDAVKELNGDVKTLDNRLTKLETAFNIKSGIFATASTLASITVVIFLAWVKGIM